MSEPLSSEEYVAQAGNLCPACRDDNIQAEIDWNCCDSSTLCQRASCLSCDAEWYEIYTLTGYADLQHPDKA